MSAQKVTTIRWLFIVYRPKTLLVALYAFLNCMVTQESGIRATGWRVWPPGCIVINHTFPPWFLLFCGYEPRLYGRFARKKHPKEHIINTEKRQRWCLETNRYPCFHFEPYAKKNWSVIKDLHTNFKSNWGHLTDFFVV